MIRNGQQKRSTIYADHNSTGLLSDDHLDQVVARLREFDGNPSSQHATGRRAKVAVEGARSALATMLGARSTELVFTSGATESNNLAIQGCLRKNEENPVRHALPHVIVGATEHPSVLEQVQTLAARGVLSVSLLPVDSSGAVSLSRLSDLIKPETILVALMFVNNETGAIHDANSAARLVKSIRPDIHFHVDAVQAFGKIDCTWIGSSSVDSVAVSGHKLGAFKGCGALFLKAGTKLSALQVGGGQERARRPGTENLPGIVSLGIKAEEWNASLGSGRDSWVVEAGQCKAQLIQGLNAIDGVVIHGDPDKDIANTLNFHIDGVSGDDLLLNLDLSGIAASSGSACSSGVGRPSHVLKAMGFSDWVALNSVRISFGPGVVPTEIDKILEVVGDTVKRIRNLAKK